jgi:uncharacterized protein YbbC (DUF1343 family)
MFQNYKTNLKKFIKDRVNYIDNNIVIKDEKYHELVEQSIKIYYQIRNTLPEQYRELLEEYESINSEMGCISEKIVYKQGFIDGIILNEIIKNIKKFAKLA